MVRKTTLIFAALAIIATVAARQAQAAEFWVIIANLNNANNPQAQLDVAVDTQALPGGAPAEVWFNVFGADGTQLAEFVVTANSNGFASSAFAAPPYNNLFNVSAGLPALVKARTPSTSSLASAVLRQTLGKSNTVFAVPPIRRADGTGVTVGRVFSGAFGDIAPGATLLIANPSGTDVAVDIFPGSKGAPSGARYYNPRLQSNTIWIVPLDPADANSHVVVSSTGNVLVQFAVGDGKKGISEGLLLPL